MILEKNNLDFISRLILRLNSSLFNNYNDNFDQLRFGRFTLKIVIKEKVKDILYNRFIVKSLIKKSSDTLAEIILSYKKELEYLYDNLYDNDSRELLIDLVSYRILGYRYVKLPLNNVDYWNAISFLDKLQDKKKYINSGFLSWNLFFYDLRNINYDISLYSTTLGIAAGFKIKQYRYKTDQKCIEAKTGDYVIDAGACWGEISLYFASKVGPTGKVFSFEFIPNNLEISRRNFSLNPHLNGQITIIDNPLWDIDDKITYFVDSGPASVVNFEPLPDAGGITKTITIDTFVNKYEIEKVDFIKMDIEGAESFALSGAINTIKKFKPTLAIAIYHSLNDFVNIPRWILDLNLGYKLYLGHYTIHLEETVLFAMAE
jgi:FkbM family methyltransferase